MGAGPIGFAESQTVNGLVVSHQQALSGTRNCGALGINSDESDDWEIEMQYDVAIVGAGSAGLTAALVLSRARRRVVVIDAGEQRNSKSLHLHGFLSRDGMSPKDLLKVGTGEVVSYGGEVINDRVAAIEENSECGFSLQLAGGQNLSARTVVVASGLRDELPVIPGLRKRWGEDVLHCPYSHGYEVSDTPLGVVGGENRTFSLHQATLIRGWSDDVVFFPNTITLTPAEHERIVAFGVQIVDGEVARVVEEDDRLTGVEMADGRIVPRSAVFIGPRFEPQDQLLKDLGCAVGENGWVTIDPTGATSLVGVWAAGNVVDSPAQLVTAAGNATVAAVAVNHHLLAEDIEQSLVDYRKYLKEMNSCVRM